MNEARTNYLLIERTKREYQQQADGISAGSHGHPTDFAAPFEGHSIEKDETRFPPLDERLPLSSLDFGG